MKTIAVTIDEDLDRRAADEARRRGISKSELIRRSLTAVLPAEELSPVPDPWRSLAGFGASDMSVGPGDVDDVVYGS